MHSELLFEDGQTSRWIDDELRPMKRVESQL